MESTPDPIERVTRNPEKLHRLRRVNVFAGSLIVLAVVVYLLFPWFDTLLHTVSTDDAYVNSHVTFVAPRVSGQVSKVLVDDNYRVKKGDLLVQLDKEPYQVQVEIRKAAVVTAQTELAGARAQVRGLEAMAGAQRWQLKQAMENVSNQTANLRANVAVYQSKMATLTLAQANLKRAEELVASGGISREELDQRRQAVKVGEAAVEQALNAIYATRAGLGLPAQPEDGKPLSDFPADLTETFSGVRTALANLIQTLSQLGLPLASENATPTEYLEAFRKMDARGNVDRVLQDLIPRAPAVNQSEAKLIQAQRALEQAELDLRYCDVVSEIDGVVTRRNVNPGNHVQPGQIIMAVRSLTEIWVDANFKETQLADLRIGQRVRLRVDLYGRRRLFEGRITGFTIGTGSTLALLPPQNATGNFVKIVQRLPVRIELIDYDPDTAPLFVGLSVVPYVYYKEPPTGPNAGKILQPHATPPETPTQSRP